MPARRQLWDGRITRLYLDTFSSLSVRPTMQSIYGLRTCEFAGMSSLIV